VVLHAVLENLDLTNTGFNPHRFGDIKNVFSGPQINSPLTQNMKIGMNLLLWATHVTEEHYPQLEKIKATGFDGVEIPIFEGDDTHYLKLRRK